MRSLIHPRLGWGLVIGALAAFGLFKGYGQYQQSFGVSGGLGGGRGTGGPASSWGRRKRQ